MAKPNHDKPTRASLEKLLAEFQRRDRELLAEQLEAERGGVEPVGETDPTTRIAAAAAALVDGASAEPPASRGNRLHQIIHERAVLNRALELARLRLGALLREQADEIARDLESAWRKNIGATADAITLLGKLNDERDRLKAEWCQRTGLPVQPGCYVEGARLTATNSACRDFIEAARRMRLIG